MRTRVTSISSGPCCSPPTPDRDQFIPGERPIRTCLRDEGERVGADVILAGGGPRTGHSITRLSLAQCRLELRTSFDEAAFRQGEHWFLE